MSTSQSGSEFPTGIDQQNKKFTTIIIYPTVTPEKIIIPMVSCILGFPLLALMVICCLRRRAKLARDRDRRRNLGERRGRLGVTVVTAGSTPASLRSLLVTVSVTITRTPASTGGNGDETDKGVSIQQSSSAMAGGINTKTDGSASDGESVETGNSTFARACTSDQGVISLARFSPMHKIGVYLAAGANASGSAMPSPLSSGGRNHPLRSESRSYASCDLDPVMEERSEMDSSCGGLTGSGPVAGVGAVADGGGVVGGGAVEALVCPDS